MLDIKLLRETPDVVRADLRKRGRDPASVDQFLAQDRNWREGLVQVESLRALRNKGSAFIGTFKRAAKEFSEANLQFEKSKAAVQKFRVHTSKPEGFLKGAAHFFTGAGELGNYYTSIETECRILLAIPAKVPPLVEQYFRFAKEVGMTPNQDAVTGLQWYATTITSDKTFLETRGAECRGALQQGTVPDPRQLQWDIEVAAKPYGELQTLVDHVQTIVEGAIAFFQDLSNKTSQWELHVQRALETRDALHRGFPNIMHPAVPVGKDDSENKEVRAWGGKPTHKFAAASHVDLLDRLDIADLERAARASGSRFFYLKGDLVLLGRALEFFALKHLAAKGFTAIEPPYMLRREALEGAIDLADFESVIYRVEAGAAAAPAKPGEKSTEPSELFLIATSEHPIAAMHMGELLETRQLPLLYAGVSPCFRKEAGSHGKDTKGIFRVHQFSKVEQFVFCAPADSWRIHEELIRNAEELYQALKIPYRVVDICTGDLGSIAARKYDIEAWMPVQGAYREVVSCSNCTDFQARRYNTRHRANPGDPTEVVHTLNSTAIAVQRTLVAILENFQQEDGSVLVPEVLQPYVGKDRITAKA